MIIFCGLPFLAWSQSPSWHEVNLENEMDIFAMVTDSLGFLWMTDQHTIYRFDGKDAEAKVELDEEGITTFTYQRHKLVVGTTLGRILTIDPYDNAVDVVDDADQSDPVTDILFVDASNYISVSYGAGVKIVHQGSTYRLEAADGLLSNEVYDVEVFNAQYYLATDQGIQIIDPSEPESEIKAITTEDGLSDIVVTQLIVRGSLLLYTDYDAHLGSITMDHQVRNHSLPQRAKINDILTYGQEVYLATEGGLLNFADGAFNRQYPQSGKEKIKRIQIDDEGNLWMVNPKGQLIKANLYFQQMDVGVRNISALVKVGSTFIIGNSDGLYWYKDEELTQINNRNITHLARWEGYVLVGTFSSGIMMYDQDMRLVQHLKSWGDYQEQSVLHIYNADEHVYVSSLTGVVEFRFQNDKLEVSRTFDDLIGPGYIYSILSTEGQIYFGTDRKGLIALDKKHHQVQRYEKFSDGQKIGSVYSMTEGPFGKIWFTSVHKGIGYIEEDTVGYIDHIRNLSDSYTSIGLADSEYLLAVRGSSVDLVEPRSGHVMSYDKELDIEGHKTYLNTMTKDDGLMYFVHSDKIYHYTSQSEIKIHPEVIIDEVLVNLAPVTDQQSFDEDDNNIEFSYLASWLTDPSKITYQYKLEGSNDDWRNTKDKNVTFRNLSPGRYKFRVRASENGLFLNEPEDTFSFEIDYHLYNMWWVRAILLLLAGAVAWKLMKINEGRKKEKLALEKLNIENQFINLKNQLNPHFLFNAFNTLIGLIEEDSDRSVAFVEHMTDFYRNMLEYGKQNLITLGQEKEILLQYVAILKARFNGQLDVQIDINDHLEEYEVPPMTLQLLLENAVKHNVVSTRNPLRISIQQNGDEISVYNQKTSLVQDVRGTKTGLQNIKRRFELVNLPAPLINESDQSFEVIIYIRKVKKICKQ